MKVIARGTLNGLVRDKIPRAPQLCVLAGLLLQAAHAQTWREIQSPHFRVITEGSEREGRDVAREFEQMRAVFAGRFKTATLETGAPLLIVAVREHGLRFLSPILWKDRDRFAGEFFTGWERKYALVRLDSFGDLNQAVVFHEYTHSILHANLHGIPLWLDEGMAEFYGYTRFQADHIYIGAPSVRLADLRDATLIPVAEMLAANTTIYRKDEHRAEIFYAEAWAMVHFISFNPEMGGAKLNQFIALLERGTPQPEAFQQVFGDPKVFLDRLSVYIRRQSLTTGVLPPAEQIDISSYPSRVLSAAELNYEVGAFDVGVHDYTEARKRLLAAESADPQLAGPHEELGFILWLEGHDDEARAEWQNAVVADPQSYRSAFALLMSGTPLRQQSPQQLQATAHALEAIEDQAPKYAPAYAEHALVQWRLRQLGSAYKTAMVAEKLEPWRAGYHLLTGHILLQVHETQLADSYARDVAARWTGADHDEAVDLWNLVPAATRSNGPDLKPRLPLDATVARGTVVSSSCDKTSLTVVLQPAGPSSSTLKLVASGPYEGGFSDTLWVGEDHYTPCFHIAGLHAVVSYKSTAPDTGKLLNLEVRDDLPDMDPPAQHP